MEIEQVMRIAAVQHGCVATQQALREMTKNQWAYLARKGVVVRKWPGVYVVKGFASTWEQRATAAVLSVPGSALSHRSAARLLGLTFVPSQRIEITAPREACPVRESLKVHRSEQLAPFAVEHQGIRTTNAARTLVDLTSCTSPKLLGKVLDQACNLKLVTFAEIEHCLDRMVTVGRSRVSNLREVLATRTTTDEKLDTFLERRTLEWLRAWNVRDPEGQFPIVANGTYYRLDLAFPEQKIAIEPDGPHHLLPSVAAYDRQRDADLNIEDWIVFHVYLETAPEDFIPRLRTALQKRARKRGDE